jgi:uncharacterized protein (DUF1778 family)
MPRRPKPPEQVKSIIVRVRFTQEQRDILQFAAEHEDRELSDWVRRLALKEATKIRDRAAAKSANRAEQTPADVAGRRR